MQSVEIPMLPPEPSFLRLSFIKLTHANNGRYRTSSLKMTNCPVGQPSFLNRPVLEHTIGKRRKKCTTTSFFFSPTFWTMHTFLSSFPLPPLGKKEEEEEERPVSFSPRRGRLGNNVCFWSDRCIQRRRRRFEAMGKEKG